MMAQLAIPAPVVAAPPPPIFRFVGGAPPHDTWTVGMPAAPDLEVLFDEPFAAWARACGWTPHPAPPAQPTHLRCPYSHVEVILHGCQRSEEAALLDSGAFTRYDLPSQLSEVLCALVETGKLVMHPPEGDLRLLLLKCCHAARIALSDPRLLLTIAKTGLVQLAPGNGPLASRWPLQVSTRDLVPAPAINLLNEAMCLWRSPARFTQASRALQTSSFHIVFEAARVRVEQDTPLMAHILVLQVQNFDTIAETVGQFLATLDIQPELIRFPSTVPRCLQDVTWAMQYCLGTPMVRQSAFVLRLPDMLVHFPDCNSVFIDGYNVPSGGLVPLVKQLVLAHFTGAQDPFSVETFREMEPRVAAVNQHMVISADPPSTVSGKVLWHEQYKHRLVTAHKDLVKQHSSNASSKVAAVQTKQFRDVSPCILAAASQEGASSDHITQLVVKSECKLLIMYMFKKTSGLAGFKEFTCMSPHRGHLDSYVAWCMSCDELGLVPQRARGRLASSTLVEAGRMGLWHPNADLYNNCKAWEQMLAGRLWASVPMEEWYSDVAMLRVMRKYGNRYLEGFGRAGTGLYSFLWMMDQGIDLLESQSHRSCSTKEILDLVQWWISAALMEAGRQFADETQADADFSLPLRNTFLRDDGTGCISKLIQKKLSLDKWESFAEDMPQTMSALLSPHNSNNAVPVNTSALSVHHNATVECLPAAKRPKLQGKHLITYFTVQCLFTSSIAQLLPRTVALRVA